MQREALVDVPAFKDVVDVRWSGVCHRNLRVSGELEDEPPIVDVLDERVDFEGPFKPSLPRMSKQRKVAKVGDGWVCLPFCRTGQ